MTLINDISLFEKMREVEVEEDNSFFSLYKLLAKEINISFNVEDLVNEVYSIMKKRKLFNEFENNIYNFLYDTKEEYLWRGLYEFLDVLNYNKKICYSKKFKKISLHILKEVPLKDLKTKSLINLINSVNFEKIETIIEDLKEEYPELYKIYIKNYKIKDLKQPISDLLDNVVKDNNKINDRNLHIFITWLKDGEVDSFRVSHLIKNKYYQFNSFEKVRFHRFMKKLWEKSLKNENFSIQELVLLFYESADILKDTRYTEEVFKLCEEQSREKNKINTYSAMKILNFLEKELNENQLYINNNLAARGKKELTEDDSNFLNELYKNLKLNNKNIINDWPEQYINCRTEVKNLRRKYSLKIPIDLNNLLNKIGISLKKHKFEENFEGCILKIKKQKKATIVLNSNFPSNRMRFTIAHELGHFLNNNHKGTFIYCEDLDNIDSWTIKETHKNIEKEANNFAAELLMPYDEIKKDLKYSDFSLELVKNNINKYKVSLIALLKKYLNNINGYYLIAYILDNKIKWIELSEDLIKKINYDFTIKEKLSEDTAAFELLEKNDISIINFKEGTLEDWIIVEDEDENYLNSFNVNEESILKYKIEGVSHLISLIKLNMW